MTAFQFPQWATSAPALAPQPATDAAEQELIAANRKAFAEAQAQVAAEFSPPADSAPKRKGWPKGKPRGPRAPVKNTK